MVRSAERRDPSAYNPLYSLAGFLVGMLVGLTGVGGGSLMTPLLVLLFGIPSRDGGRHRPALCLGHQEVGTAVHRHRQTVEWRIVALLATGSLPGGDRHALCHEPRRHPRRARLWVLNVLLGGALVITGVSTLFRAVILNWAKPRMRETAAARSPH